MIYWGPDIWMESWLWWKITVSIPSFCPFHFSFLAQRCGVRAPRPAAQLKPPVLAATMAVPRPWHGYSSYRPNRRRGKGKRYVHSQILPIIGCCSGHLALKFGHHYEQPLTSKTKRWKQINNTTQSLFPKWILMKKTFKANFLFSNTSSLIPKKGVSWVLKCKFKMHMLFIYPACKNCI